MVLVTSSQPGWKQSAPLQDAFFSFVRADGPGDLSALHRIRYQVYCLECGFLSGDDYPDGLEQDEFDAHSVHLMATHISGVPAGTVRLVLHSPLGFPLTHHCELFPDYMYLRDPGHPSLAKTAEISRLAVTKAFRRREGDDLYGGPPRRLGVDKAGAEVIQFPVPRNAPEIVSGIYRSMYQESKRHGIEHWIVAMERGLHILLSRMGFVFTPIGPKIDYYGPVRPYLAHIGKIEQHLLRTAPDVCNYMLRGLEPELHPFVGGDAVSEGASRA